MKVSGCIQHGLCSIAALEPLILHDGCDRQQGKYAEQDGQTSRRAALCVEAAQLLVRVGERLLLPYPYPPPTTTIGTNTRRRRRRLTENSSYFRETTKPSRAASTAARTPRQRLDLPPPCCNMKFMFEGAVSFNQPLNNWNVSNDEYVENV